MTTIFLVDDHAVVRDGLRLILEAEPEFSVVGEAGTGREAVLQVRNLYPDVVIMDIAMPEMNGIEATRQIRAACDRSQVIMLSMHMTGNHIRRALQAGAVGYVLKSAVGSDLIEAIKTVRRGSHYLSPRIAERVIDDYVTVGQASESPLDRLSPREQEILQLVVESKSSAEIAKILHIAPSTVETYRSRLMQKLEIGNLADLVKFALRHGLTSLD